MTASTHSQSNGSAAKEKDDLPHEQRLFFRDRLREARYAALADAEGFQQMCFAIEELGKRLNPKGNGLGSYQRALQELASMSALLPRPGGCERAMKSFDALFIGLREARNDVMHTGAYARHVAADAVTLCLVLEDALMVEKKSEELGKRETVGDFMVSTPVVVQPWQTVEHARHVMLLNSFSYLPIWREGKWWLISDIAVAKYLRPRWPAKSQLTNTLEEAKKDGLHFVEVTPVQKNNGVASLLDKADPPGLWLVIEASNPPSRLVGVLSPFELM
jgi:hypothetical protein